MGTKRFSTPNSIPEILHQPAYDKYAEGRATEEQILEWLTKEHGVVTSRSSVHRLLFRMKKEKQAAARAAYADAMAKAATSDIAIMSDMITKLKSDFDANREAGEQTQALRSASVLKQYLDLRLGTVPTERDSNRTDTDEIVKDLKESFRKISR